MYKYTLILCTTEDWMAKGRNSSASHCRHSSEDILDKCKC